MQALLVPVGGEWHALDLSRVREVLHAPVVTAVPDGPPWLAGVVNVRGEILAAVDTSIPLGGTGVLEPSHVIVADTVKGKAALCASGPPEPVELLERCGDGAHPGVVGRYVVDERVASLVDLDELLGGG